APGLRRPASRSSGVSRRSLGQAEDGQNATELRVVGQGLVRPDGPETVGVLGQTGCHTDAGPATDTGQDCNILLAAMGEAVDVANDPGRRLESIEFLAGLDISG